MYLIIGANGFLGSYIMKNILEKTDDIIVAVARHISSVFEHPRIQWESCDISNATEVDMLCENMNGFKDCKIVFLAAYHNPDLVEKNPVLAWNINVTSLSYFINRISEAKCLFYSSTDSVYGNSIAGYRFMESDQLNPINTYGCQKCAAEAIVMWRGYNVVRYPFLIAPSLLSVKKHFYDVIAETLVQGKNIEMFADSYRSTISFDTGAAILVDLIERYSEKTPKVLNICGDDSISKYDVGIMIADKLNVDRSLVVPIRMSDSPNIFDAKRAQSTLLNNEKLKNLLDLPKISLEI